jgi:hypothetical protein
MSCTQLEGLAGGTAAKPRGGLWVVACVVWARRNLASTALSGRRSLVGDGADKALAACRATRVCRVVVHVQLHGQLNPGGGLFVDGHRSEEITVLLEPGGVAVTQGHDPAFQHGHARHDQFQLGLPGCQLGLGRRRRRWPGMRGRSGAAGVRQQVCIVSIVSWAQHRKLTAFNRFSPSFCKTGKSSLKHY